MISFSCFQVAKLVLILKIRKSFSENVDLFAHFCLICACFLIYSFFFCILSLFSLCGDDSFGCCCHFRDFD